MADPKPEQCLICGGSVQPGIMGYYCCEHMPKLLVDTFKALQAEFGDAVMFFGSTKTEAEIHLKGTPVIKKVMGETSYRQARRSSILIFEFVGHAGRWELRGVYCGLGVSYSLIDVEGMNDIIFSNSLRFSRRNS